MKKIIIASLFIIPLISTSVYADDSIKDLRKEVKTQRQEVLGETKTLREDLQNLKNKIISQVPKVGRIISGQVSGKSASSLTITKDGKTITVNILSSTKIIRHYWGKSTVNEISIGDKVNVYGTFKDDAHTIMDARLIRDLSIMKRHAVFLGTVSSISGSTIVIATQNRGNQTVTVSTPTKFVNRKEQPIVLSDIKVGQRIRVKGMWDRALNTITEVTQVKDFTIPVIPSTTPTP